MKWEGSPKPTWEPEENLTGCQELIDNFLFEEKTRLRMEEERRKREDVEGHYEVGRIIEVQFKKSGSREFQVRWKGHGAADDTWEPEENLDCVELIEKFMLKHEAAVAIEEKSLRIAPKRVERLAFSYSARYRPLFFVYINLFKITMYRVFVKTCMRQLSMTVL